MQYKTNNRSLSPTLWRTCRALANKRRLHLLRHVMRSPGVSVSSVARDTGMPVTIVSQYLRSLNARGLLQVKRRGRQVLYSAAPDPSLPESAVLLEAIKRAFSARTSPLERAFQDLTAFTHPRRILLIRAVATGADSLEAIRAKTGVSVSAAVRHLRKLRRRGYVVQSAGRYVCPRPSGALAWALMRLVLGAK